MRKSKVKVMVIVTPNGETPPFWPDEEVAIEFDSSGVAGFTTKPTASCKIPLDLEYVHAAMDMWLELQGGSWKFFLRLDEHQRRVRIREESVALPPRAFAWLQSSL